VRYRSGFEKYRKGDGFATHPVRLDPRETQVDRAVLGRRAQIGDP
jgi:hypothetical protein